mgnify:CR=1 FL=1
MTVISRSRAKHGQEGPCSRVDHQVPSAPVGSTAGNSTLTSSLKRATSRGAKHAVKEAALWFDRVRPPTPGVTVLAYHRVGGGTSLELDVEPGVFARHMEWLATTARVITLDRGLDELCRPDGPAGVVITFDDGTADFVDHALPALVANEVAATYYVATDFIEQQRPFPDNGTPLTWGALAEAISTGLVTVGSHTHTHAVMGKLNPSQARHEVERSVGLIEDRLGVAVDHFAYPKGVHGGQAIEVVVADRFRSAALVGGAANHFGATNPLRVDRSPIQRSDTTSQFAHKAAGGMRLEGIIRNQLNRRRYQSARN